jgi:hypothetical protein
LADARALGARGFIRAGSTPVAPTISNRNIGHAIFLFTRSGFENSRSFCAGDQILISAEVLPRDDHRT